MNRPIVRPLVGLAIAAASLTLASAHMVAQSAATKNISPSRTSDHQPDFQGFWTNDTFTPLERPAELAGKPFFTEAEAASELKQRTDRSIWRKRPVYGCCPWLMSGHTAATALA